MRIATIIKGCLLALMTSLPLTQANAQYYEIANRLPSLISPALSGSMKYKGFVEAGYNTGVCHFRQKK